MKNLTDSDEGKLHILKVVYEVWRNHPQVQTNPTKIFKLDWIKKKKSFSDGCKMDLNVYKSAI